MTSKTQQAAPARSEKFQIQVHQIHKSFGEHHVIRGAGWMDHIMSELRLSYREYGDEARPDVGFRIARYAE